MDIVEGLIAVVIPDKVSICPQGRLGVIIYGKPATEDNPSGMVEKPFRRQSKMGKRGRPKGSLSIRN